MVRTYGASFEKLYAAAVGTRLGDAARTSAVAVLAAELTGSPAAISAVSAMSFAPWLLFGLPAGALVDRWDKRRAFLAADSIRCATAALLCGLALAGHMSIALLIVFVFLLTTVQTVSDSCFNSLLPSIVPQEDLGAANTRLSASQSTVGIVAAPLGSWLSTVSSALPFLLNVVTFGAAAGWVKALPKNMDRQAASKPANAEPRRLSRDIRDGLGAVRTRGLLSALLLCVSVNNFCNGLNSAMLPLLAIRSVGLHPAAFGALAGSSAACMVAGNLLAGRLAAHGTPHHHVAGLAIGLKLPGFLLICAAHSPMPLILGTAVLGLATGLWNVPSSTLLMASAPREMIGRTMALFRTVSVAGMPLGALASGLLASMTGVRSSSLAAALLSGVVLLGYLRSLRHLPTPELTSPARK
ncbi:MFS transporter [Streptomyces brevispora]|uniref:MFS transporter n=1 Tax=Streptomyces brevispora TaxID=887462 RepID=UPI0037FE74E1